MRTRRLPFATVGAGRDAEALAAALAAQQFAEGLLVDFRYIPALDLATVGGTSAASNDDDVTVRTVAESGQIGGQVILPAHWETFSVYLLAAATAINGAGTWVWSFDYKAPALEGGVIGSGTAWTTGSSVSETAPTVASTTTLIELATGVTAPEPGRILHMRINRGDGTSDLTAEVVGVLLVNDDAN